MNKSSFLPKLFLALLLPVLAACQQNQQPLQTHSKKDSSTSTAVVAPAIVEEKTTKAIAGASDSSSTVVLKEDFEQRPGTKASYAAAAVTFRSGSWILDNALLGGTNADAKNGSSSVRLRNEGKLSMRFDLKGVKSVALRYGSYGTDGISSWQLWASADGGATYQQVGETLSSSGNALSEAVFHPEGGTRLLRFEIRKVSGGKNRLNIDDFSINGTEVTAEGEPEAPATAERKVQQPAAPVNSSVNLLLGNPSNAAARTSDADNFLIDQVYYVESYNKSRAVPNWVSWHIGSADLGSTDRLNNFRPDTGLPKGWYEVDNTSYKGSGFDKGHNCPSGDRTSSTAANAATFLMDNMIPQAPNNNQHTWEHLESYCRAQVKKGFETYVIMGSYGSGGRGRNGYVTTIDQGRINVPAHIWKVVVIIPEGENDLQRINANTTVIAVDTPNDDSISADWMKYTCTVRDIEKATGYNLLSALPVSLQNLVETRAFKGGN